LYKHKRKSHREKQRQLDQDPAGLKGETCEFCSSIFTRKDLYYKHANDAHKDLVIISLNSCFDDCSKKLGSFTEEENIFIICKTFLLLSAVALEIG